MTNPEEEKWKDIFGSFLDSLNLDDFNSIPEINERPSPHHWLEVDETLKKIIESTNFGRRFRAEDILASNSSLFQQTLTHLCKHIAEEVSRCSYLSGVRIVPNILVVALGRGYRSSTGLEDFKYAAVFGIESWVTERDYRINMQYAVSNANAELKQKSKPLLPPYPFT